MKHYKVSYTKRAVKMLKKLAPSISSMIYEWIGKKLEGCEDPRLYGRALTGNLIGKWRYRVGDWRIIAKIEDAKVLILVLSVEHRSKVYH